MARNARGVMERAMRAGTRGKGGRAGGKAGKRTLGDRAREQLREATAQGAKEPAAASEKLLELAEIANQRGMPQVAAYLALRSSELKLDAGENDGAFVAARAAVGHAEGIAEQKRVGRFFTRTLKKLKKADEEAASELAQTARSQLGLKKLPTPGERMKPNRAQRRMLPKACSVCGTKLDAKELEFEDDGTMDCPTCGATIA